MADINSTVNTKPDPGQALDKQWDVKSLMEKVLELQDLLVQAQEKNLLLSAQARELERAARDTDDLKAELTAQGLILADKARENKSLHQEFSRLTSLLNGKMQKVEELNSSFADLHHQVKSREQERDILSVMLNDMESTHKRTLAEFAEAEEIIRALVSEKEKLQTTTGGWLAPFKKRN